MLLAVSDVLAHSLSEALKKSNVVLEHLPPARGLLLPYEAKKVTNMN